MATRPPAAVSDWEDVTDEWEDVTTPASPLPVEEADLEFERRQQAGPPSLLQAGLRGALQTPAPVPLVGGLGSRTGEEALERLPGALGTIGALGGPGLATAGAAGGEAARQLVRRTAGLPAATGLIQRSAGLDPNSPEAAVAGLGAETALGPIGNLLGRVLSSTAGATRRHAMAVLARMLKPRTARDIADAPALAERIVAEGIAPPLSGRGTQLARTGQALESAGAERAGLQQQLAQRPVPGQPVLQAVTQEQARMAPLPAMGRTDVRAGEKVGEDVLDLMAQAERQGYRGGTVPLEKAVEQKRALDELLSTYYEGGKTAAPSAARAHYTKTAADAWRRAISGQFPELGRASLRESELIRITQLMRDAEQRAFATGTAGAQAAEVGGAITGRASLPAVGLLRTVFQSPRYASLSSAGQRAVADLLQGGADTAQLWLRVADYFNVPDEPPADVRKRAAARKQVLSPLPGAR